MRQITEVLTCDVCGKTAVIQRVYIGVETKLQCADPLSTRHTDNEIYEVRPTHLCGKCANAIAAAAAQRVAEIRKTR